MRAIAVIPARMGSSRFPGKPMAPLHGVPMVGHCYFRTRMCVDLDATYVATCDREIFDYVTTVGGEAIMTSPDHERATDRVAEAMVTIEERDGVNADIVVLVQGDEPMVTPEMISQALSPFATEPDVSVVNLMARIASEEEFRDPNEVKVVVDSKGDALYFSREAIPSRAKWDGAVPMRKQVCIIPFRRESLLEFNRMEPTELERVESVDMMRILEHGGSVRMILTGTECYSVDTPQDLARVEARMAADPLMARYARSAQSE